LLKSKKDFEQKARLRSNTQILLPEVPEMLNLMAKGKAFSVNAVPAVNLSPYIMVIKIKNFVIIGIEKPRS
jgi:hypothetical protein